MRHETLFNGQSGDIYSKAFMVWPNEHIVISAWGIKQRKVNLDPGEPKSNPQLIILQQMAFEAGLYPHGSACGNTSIVGNIKYDYVEDVTGCGLYALSACYNKVVLSIPGTYRFRLNDTAMVGEVFVAMSVFTGEEISYIPPTIYLGA